MNSSGVLEGSVQPYTGPDEDGTQSFVSTYGTAYRAIAGTPEQAERDAVRAWQLGEPDVQIRLDRAVREWLDRIPDEHDEPAGEVLQELAGKNDVSVEALGRAIKNTSW